MTRVWKSNILLCYITMSRSSVAGGTQPHERLGAVNIAAAGKNGTFVDQCVSDSTIDHTPHKE